MTNNLELDATDKRYVTIDIFGLPWRVRIDYFPTAIYIALLVSLLIYIEKRNEVNHDIRP